MSQQGTPIMANSVASARGVVYRRPAIPAIAGLPSDSGGTSQRSVIGLLLILYLAVGQESRRYIITPQP